MNLILQSPVTISAQVIEQVGRLLDQPTMTHISAEVVRFDNVGEADRDHLQALEPLFSADRIDVGYVGENQRLSDYKLLVMDMDSTLITIECVDEIADYAGLKSEVAAITEAAMRGEITDYNESLRRRVALLKGLDASVLEQVYHDRLRLSVGAERLLETVRSTGIKTLLVSGGFTFFTDRLKQRLGLDFTRANTLGMANSKLDGNVVGEIVNAEVKARTVKETCLALGIHPSQCIVMGDGSNDLAMMQIAGLSVAFHAKPVVQRQASIALNFVGLDGLLNLLPA